MGSLQGFKIVRILSATIVVSAGLAGTLAAQATPVTSAQKADDKPIKLVDLGTGGQAPDIGRVRGMSQDGKFLELEFAGGMSRLEMRTVEFDEPEEQGGKTVTKTTRQEKAVFVPVMDLKSRTRPYPIDRVRVYDSEGRRVPASKLAGLFAKPRLILWTREGLKVDPAYLSVAREGTLFVVLPNMDPLTPPAMPLPGIAPPAPEPKKPVTSTK